MLLGLVPDGGVVRSADGKAVHDGGPRLVDLDLQVLQVPPPDYDGFPGAREIRETFQYFEECTYFGPDREKHIAAANALVPGGFTQFADWARLNMKPSPVSVRSPK